jgi:hypothetical protein
MAPVHAATTTPFAAARRLARRTLRGLPRRVKLARRRAVAVYNRRYRWTYGRSLAHVPSRDELPALLNARRLFGDAAEIGVKTGKYSDFLLSRWRGRKLISIDPWLAAETDEYVDRANVPQDAHERFLAETRQRLAPHGARSEILRLTSLEAAERVADRTLDFVYIDARHDYDSVLEDLAAWYTKVRPGGIVAGHDYVDGTFPSGVFGVKRAVDEFFGARGIRVYSTGGPSAVEMFPSWLVEVPDE